MNFQKLKTFRVIAALGSFSKAASVLHCSQSTASTQVKALEEELGVTLFLRLGTSICLTKAGETYLAYANRILSMHEEARERVRNTPGAPVTLAIRMPQSLSDGFLPRILERYHKAFPHVGLDVSVCAFAELQAELRTGVTDVAFLLADSVTRDDLHVQLLSGVRLNFVCSRDFSLSWKGGFEFADLAGCVLFVPKHDCSYKMQLTQELIENGITPQAVVECNSMSMLKQCIARGLGVALVPAFAVQEDILAQDLVTLPLASLQRETGLLLILHKGKWISDELGCFLDMCKEEMSALEPSEAQ